MSLRVKSSIRTKLALLAGVPVVGALLLALFVASDARQRATSAASLGDIEDLARLTATMTALLHAVQDERAATAVTQGLGPAARTAPSADNLTAVRRDTDEAARRLEIFLSTRDRSKLAPRLSRGLWDTRTALEGLARLRSPTENGAVDLTAILSRYREATRGLVEATAALAELSDDAEMLRNLSAVGALLELEERSSIEHAIVGYVTARGEFPPGTFKALVTTATEESVYDQAFRASASDAVREQFEGARARGGDARRLLESLLESTENTVSLEVAAWNRAQNAAVDDLRDVEHVLLGRIGSAAAGKAAELRRAIRLSTGVSIAVLLLSLTMAVLVGRGVQGSVRALTDAAAKVRVSRDYATRAKRVSDDELGLLTETFNDMLSGIQSRDVELEQHRCHLEGLVAIRTRELEARNTAMRLVLDNVDQGLATIGIDGALQGERSAAFDRWFDAAAAEPRRFYEVLADGNEAMSSMLKFAWEQVTEGFLPVDAAIDQLPRRVDLGDRHFTLTAKPILEGESLRGALLVVSDVTKELEARREQAGQREEVRVFRRVAQDKPAFAAFFEETGSMVARLETEILGPAQQLSLVHTIKGNAAQYEVASVADAAHTLESAIVDAGRAVTLDAMKPLFEAWSKLRQDLAAFFGATDSVIELSAGELRRLIERVEYCRMPARAIAARLRMLFDEPVAVRFARLGEHAERLAARLGKPAPTFTIQTDDLRLPRQRYAPFWASLVHVVRNCVDHGIESAARRSAAGKAPRGHLAFLAVLEEDGGVTIEIEDDGAGVDWARVSAKAQAMGLPVGRQEDVERAIFAPGVSTLQDVTDVSGRGVGLAAVWSATESLDGTVSVASRPGRETRFVFRLPPSDRSDAAPLASPGRYRNVLRAKE
jgi:hypothetical protein